jgi:hypothetical protein
MKCSFEKTTSSITHPQPQSDTEMSTVLAIPAMNPQKRKRNIVSYAELDQLPDLFSDDEDMTAVPHDESSNDESDNDDRTYSKHKVDFGPFQIQPTHSLTDPRKHPKRHQRRREQSMPTFAKKPRSLSHSWNCLQNFAT